MTIKEIDQLTDEDFQRYQITDRGECWKRSIDPQYRRMREQQEAALKTPPAPAAAAVRYVTVEEAKKIALNTAIACGRGAMRVVKQEIAIPFKARIDKLEAKHTATADVSKMAEIEGQLRALEGRVADASMVATRVDVDNHDTRISTLASKLDKALQTISAQSKHINAIEKKFGDLVAKQYTIK
jgi:hypothetical protein